MKSSWQDFDAQGQNCHCWQEMAQRKLSAMTTALVLVALLALLVYGLDRNHIRAGQPRRRLSGSVDVEDRDFARVVAEVRNRPAAPRQERVVSARRGARVRPANAIR